MCQHFWPQAYDINNFIFPFMYKTITDFKPIIILCFLVHVQRSLFYAAAGSGQQPDCFMVYVRTKVVQITQKSVSTWYSYLTTPFIIFFNSEPSITLIPPGSDCIWHVECSSLNFFMPWPSYS